MRCQGGGTGLNSQKAQKKKKVKVGGWGKKIKWAVKAGGYWGENCSENGQTKGKTGGERGGDTKAERMERVVWGKGGRKTKKTGGSSPPIATIKKFRRGDRKKNDIRERPTKKQEKEPLTGKHWGLLPYRNTREGKRAGSQAGGKKH